MNEVSEARTNIKSARRTIDETKSRASKIDASAYEEARRSRHSRRWKATQIDDFYDATNFFVSSNIISATITIFATRALSRSVRGADWSLTWHRWQLQRMHAQFRFRPLRPHMKSNLSKSRQNTIQQRRSLAREPETHPLTTCIITTTIGADNHNGEVDHQPRFPLRPLKQEKRLAAFWASAPLTAAKPWTWKPRERSCSRCSRGPLSAMHVNLVWGRPKQNSALDSVMTARCTAWRSNGLASAFAGCPAGWVRCRYADLSVTCWVLRVKLWFWRLWQAWDCISWLRMVLRVCLARFEQVRRGEGTRHSSLPTRSSGANSAGQEPYL